MTMSEVRKLRTEFEKVFRLHGGRYRSEVSQVPVHVDNGMGWEDVSAMPDPPADDGSVRYSYLPYVHVTIQGNRIEARARKGEWWIRVKSDQVGMSYAVSLEGFKSLMEIPDRDSAPGKVRTLVAFSPDLDLEPVPGGIMFLHKGRSVWSMRRPTMIDARKEAIVLQMEETVRLLDRREFTTVLPSDWLDDPDRAWPVIFDPTHTSEEISVANEGTTYYTMPADREFELGTAECHWKGVDAQSGSLTEVHNSNIGYGQGTVNTPFPSVPGGGLFDHLISYHVWTSNYTLDPSPDQVPYAFNCGNSFWAGDSYQTKQQGSWNRTSPSSYDIAKIGTNAASGQANWMPSDYCSFQVTAYTYYYPVTHTVNPTVITTKESAYTGTILNGIWSAYQPLLGFAEGENTFHHHISGSGQAVLQFRYPWTYKRPTLLHTAKIATPGGNMVVRLVSMTDPALVYRCWRISFYGLIYCIDMVDTDDPEAGPLRIYHPIHGTICARKVI